jgi:hypothetical protein
VENSNDKFDIQLKKLYTFQKQKKIENQQTVNKSVWKFRKKPIIKDNAQDNRVPEKRLYSNDTRLKLDTDIALEDF